MQIFVNIHSIRMLTLMVVVSGNLVPLVQKHFQTTKYAFLYSASSLCVLSLSIPSINNPYLCIATTTRFGKDHLTWSASTLASELEGIMTGYSAPQFSLRGVVLLHNNLVRAVHSVMGIASQFTRHALGSTVA